MPFHKLYRFSATTAGYLARLTVFGGILFAFYLLYKLLLGQAFDGSKQVYPILALWLISAYVVMPRIHRTLSRYYLPSYFVGRIRSPSGFLADPINVAFIAGEEAIHTAMKQAGWTRADQLKPNTFFKTVYSSLLRMSYPSAPVGNMYLFQQKQNFAYEIEVNGSPNERHHIRFWKTPDNWYLPGGHTADWLAAATYDTHVGIKIATGQIDHFINENIDEERDFTIAKLKNTGLTKDIEVIKHFTNAYHDKNNGGDSISTDGSLPFITL
jgi:hypothetical protein